MLEFSMIHADLRREALERWLAGELGGKRFTLSPGIRRRELPPLFPRRERRRLDADRHGRAAGQGGLPAIRACGAAAA
jgi:hypothetical protein